MRFELLTGYKSQCFQFSTPTVKTNDRNQKIADFYTEIFKTKTEGTFSGVESKK